MRLLVFAAAFLLPLTALGQPVFTLVTDQAGLAHPGASHGAAWGDLNGDHWPDLVVANQQFEANFVLLNNHDGTFTRRHIGPAATDSSFSAAVAFGDIDGDGDLDLFIAEGSTDVELPNRLYRNDGTGALTAVPTEEAGDLLLPAQNTENAAFADADGDGDLDLFVVNWSGQTNAFYLNDGTGRFTAKLGFATIEGDYAVSVNWRDVDHDGDADLYVARQGLSMRLPDRQRVQLSSQNTLYRNDGTGDLRPLHPGQYTYRDPIAHDTGQSITSSWGDVDNDGDADLYVGNFAGEPNDFYRNNGDTTFTQVTTSPLARDGGVTLGSAFGDFDLDGDLDLFAANGYGREEDDFFYLNTGDGTFTKVLEGPLVTAGGRSVATVAADYDRDGDLDLFITELGEGPSRLYRNDSPPRSWLQVRCVGTTANTTALGTRVAVTALIDGQRVTQTREIAQQTGFGGHHELLAHFGLGEAQTVETLTITWPDGLVQTVTGLPANQDLLVVQGQAPLPTPR